MNKYQRFLRDLSNFLREHEAKLVIETSVSSARWADEIPGFSTQFGIQFDDRVFMGVSEDYDKELVELDHQYIKEIFEDSKEWQDHEFEV